jgi:hypothetical protein
MIFAVSFVLLVSDHVFYYTLDQLLSAADRSSTRSSLGTACIPATDMRLFSGSCLRDESQAPSFYVFFAQIA